MYRVFTLMLSLRRPRPRARSGGPMNLVLRMLTGSVLPHVGQLIRCDCLMLILEAGRCAVTWKTLWMSVAPTMFIAPPRLVFFTWMPLLQPYTTVFSYPALRWLVGFCIG